MSVRGFWAIAPEPRALPLGHAARLRIQTSCAHPTSKTCVRYWLAVNMGYTHTQKAVQFSRHRYTLWVIKTPFLF